MSVGKVFDHIRKQVTDETTTSDAITYLPSGFTSVQKALKTLSRLKKHWKIDVIGEGNGYRVLFGDVLEVAVANEHWSDFAEKVLRNKRVSYAGSFEIDLGGYLKEAKEDDIAKAAQAANKALFAIFLKDPIKSAGDNIATWNQMFSFIKYSTGNNVLIRFEAMSRDIKELTKKLDHLYSDDRGMLELLSSTISQQRPLGTFEGFDNAEFLIGSRIESTYNKIPLAYETLVDMSFVPREHIVIQDKEVLDNIEGTAGVRVATNTVFPTGKQFTKKHFQAVKNAIDDSISKE